MPTGYTADVAVGKVSDLRTFALRCARAFGATVAQRDEPSDEPPKHREMPSFYAEMLARAEAEQARFTTMTLAEAESEMVAEREKAIAYRDEYLAGKAAQRARYESMLEEVKAWNPPTAEHVHLKDFMEQQIRESIDFDCGGSYEPAVPAVRPATAWIADKRAKAAAEVARLIQSMAEEQERCDRANAWIDALYDSLPAAGLHEGGR